MIHIPKKLFTVRNYNKYYTSIIDNNQCLFSFNNKETANKCALFLSEYRHRYGKWPELKNYEDQIKDNELQLIEPSKLRPLLNIFYNLQDCVFLPLLYQQYNYLQQNNLI